MKKNNSKGQADFYPAVYQREIAHESIQLK